MLDGLVSTNADLENPPAYFARVFAALPSEVTVYPSENYYYFTDFVAGRQIWGNVRLPAGQREKGILSFAYAEYFEFPTKPEKAFHREKWLNAADGVTIEPLGKFTFRVRFQKRAVTFHLHRLAQLPPKQFPLRKNEVFIERTFDESGLQFFLLFNTERNYFFWVLNEEEKVPESFEAIERNVLVGRRTGFAFWIDREAARRKLLVAVRGLSVRRNDYFDGPFDQLADNDAEQTKISEWMVRSLPALEGRIDKFGYRTDTNEPTRVALSCYGMYETQEDILRLVAAAMASHDVYEHISRVGLPADGAASQPENETKSATPSGQSGKK